MLRTFATIGVALSALVPIPALAMGYDSLACPELAERRIAYFTSNGFCDPAKAADNSKPDGTGCKAIAAGSEAVLPEPDRTQVQLIIRTEGRKSCPVK